jgi:NitT/TauT family transport system ATP-binding protein
VTHDIAEAAYLADRIAVMHQGKLIHQETVAMPRPRLPEIRFSNEFSSLCRDLHDAMRTTQ